MSKIENLREVWPGEATDFTPWLAEEANIKLLGDTIGIDMVIEEREASVGSFNVDLLAKEDGGDERKIIIENQLESTNHDHLGKLITYASGRNAAVIIWIVKTARAEHANAVQWLNQHTDDTLSFFLIEIELWRIGSSPIAPKFNIIEQPNEWARNAKSGDVQSETKLQQLNFWGAFRDSSRSDNSFMRAFSLQKADSRPYYALRIGYSNYKLVLRTNSQRCTVSVGLYIRGDKNLYHRLRQQEEKIHNELESTLVWRESEKDCSIMMTRKGDIFNQDSWPEIFAWFREQSLKMRPLFKKLIEA